MPKKINLTFYIFRTNLLKYLNLNVGGYRGENFWRLKQNGFIKSVA